MNVNTTKEKESDAKLSPPNISLRLESALRFLENNTILKIVARIGQTIGWLSLFIATGTFVYNYRKDQTGKVEQSHFQAWTLINMQSGKPGNGGQIQALEALVRDRVPLHGVSLRGAFLDGVNLRRALAEQADFREAQLEHANLSYGDFNNADFSGANLVGSVLIAFNNSGIDSPRRIITGGFDPKAATAPQDPRDERRPGFTITPRAFGVRFVGADLSTTKLMDANLDSARLDNAIIEYAYLYRTSLRGANLTGASLKGTDISAADFGADNYAAIVTQHQINSACADPQRPPKLPAGITPPPRHCSRTWR